MNIPCSSLAYVFSSQPTLSVSCSKNLGRSGRIFPHCSFPSTGLYGKNVYKFYTSFWQGIVSRGIELFIVRM
jgi:hypothetical protein